MFKKLFVSALILGAFSVAIFATPASAALQRATDEGGGQNLSTNFCPLVSMVDTLLTNITAMEFGSATQISALDQALQVAIQIDSFSNGNLNLGNLLAQLKSLAIQKNNTLFPLVIQQARLGVIILKGQCNIMPYISISIAPQSGPIGTSVVMSGSGFDAASNSVAFETTGNLTYASRMLKLPSLDGKTITFTIPATMTRFSEAGDTEIAVIPGVYQISVSTQTTKSKPVNFTVVAASQSQPGADAYIKSLQDTIAALTKQLQSLLQQVAALQTQVNTQQHIGVPQSVPPGQSLPSIYAYPEQQTRQSNGATVGVLKTLLAPKGDIWGLAWDGAAFWAATPYGEIDRVDQNGTTLSSVRAQLRLGNTASFNGNVFPGLAWDGSNLWISKGNHIAKLDSAGNEISGFDLPTKEWATGLAWDGTSLWFLDRGAQTINRMGNNGSVTFSVPVAGGWQLLDGLEYFNQNLYAVDAQSNTLIKMDANGNVVTTMRLPGTTSVDLASDGSSLWVADVDDNVFRKIDINNLQIQPPPPPTQTPSIQVLSPNGGETFHFGSPINVQWRSTGLAAPVSIHLSFIRDGGGLCKIAEVSPQTTSATITLPAENSICQGRSVTQGQYEIFIDHLTPGVYTVDHSDAPFSIVGSGGGNLPPVVSGVSGPSNLQVGQRGTWSVTASDPEGGPLSYSVVWGDEGQYGRVAPGPGIAQQTATFTHVYNTAGTFTPTFTVTDNGGLTAQTSISVVVGSASSIFQGSLNTAFAPPAVSVGVVSAKIASFNLQAPSAEGIQMTTVTVKTSQDVSSGFRLQNLQVRVDGVQYGLTQPALSGGAAYTFAGNINIPAGTVKTVDVFGDVLSGSAPGTYVSPISLAGGTGNGLMTFLSYPLNRSGGTPISTSNPLGGQNMTVAMGAVSVGRTTTNGCGDLANNDGLITQDDVTALQNYVFLGSPVPSDKTRADVNGDGLATPSDVVILTNYLYVNGPDLKCPGGNLPPVVSGISGPAALKVNETGTWMVVASDPEGKPLRYAVWWGDEGEPGAGPSYSVFTTPALTHAYARSGTFTPRFWVIDDANANSVQKYGNPTTVSAVARGAPVITALSQTAVLRGTQLVNFKIYGYNFTGADALGNGGISPVSDRGLTLNSFNLDSDGVMTAWFTVSGGATPGTRTITITTPAGTSNAVTLTVQ